jgi:DNA-binding beta-propeller fold protein YncE
MALSTNRTRALVIGLLSVVGLVIILGFAGAIMNRIRGVPDYAMPVLEMAEEGNPVVSVLPSRAELGATVFITGAHWPSGALIRFRLTYPDGASAVSIGHTWADDYGTFRIPFVLPVDLPLLGENALILEASGETPGGRELQLAMPLQVTRTGWPLVVAVTAADAQPLEGAHVTLFDAVGQVLAEAFTRDDGKATIPEVPLGSYMIGVRKLDFALSRTAVDISRRETEVPVSLQPSVGGRLFIGGIDNSLTLIDTASNLPLVRLEDVSQTYSLVRGVNGRYLYSGRFGGTIVRFDAETGEEDEVLPIKSDYVQPTFLALRPADEKTIFGLLRFQSDNDERVYRIVKIDLESQSVTASATDIPSFGQLVLTPDGSRLIHVGHWSKTFTILSTDPLAVLRTIEVDENPGRSVLAPDGIRLFTTLIDSGVLAVVDIQEGTVVPGTTTSAGSIALALHPSKQFLYVVNEVFGYCQVLDPDTLQVKDTFPVGKKPRAMALSSDGQYLYIAEESDPIVHVIDTSTYEQVDSITLSSRARTLEVPN